MSSSYSYQVHIQRLSPSPTVQQFYPATEARPSPAPVLLSGDSKTLPVPRVRTILVNFD